MSATDEPLSDDRLKCSFCGKSQGRVKKLIAGPRVYICDECIGLCIEILEDEGFLERRWGARELLVQLDRYEADSQPDMSAAEARSYTDAATRFVRWLNKGRIADQT